MAAERDRALKAMLSFAKVSPNLVSWQESRWGDETSARCLLALVTVQPNHPHVAGAVRYLLLQRKGGMWMSTRDTSCILVALSKLWSQSKALDVGGELTVSVNGRPIRTLRIDKDTLTAPDFQFDLPVNALRPGDNRVEFRKAGGGVCYYSINTRQTVVQDRVGPLVSGPGWSVERRFYLLSAQRLEDGTLRMLPSEQPVGQARRGDILRCEVVVKTDRPRQFVMVEAPIPSNVHVTEREDPGEYEEWYWWFDKIVVRDNRVAFFSRELEIGEHRFTFNCQAEGIGKAAALPANAFNMYDPTDRASSGSLSLEVSPK
jgi:hypothetical protein